MKQILFAVALLSSLPANNIYWQSNFDEAHHQAIEKSKKLMVLLIEKDSLINKSILIKTFMKQDYIDVINEKYISVIITKNQKSSYPIESLFTVEYPALFFLDDNELFFCDPLFGNLTPDRLRAHLLECSK